MITVVHTYPLHSLIPVNSKNSLSSSHFSPFSKETAKIIAFQAELIYAMRAKKLIIEIG
jgi:hypothetical protein